MRLSLKRAARNKSTPRFSTGNPGERSGGICSAPCGSLQSFLGSKKSQPPTGAKRSGGTCGFSPSRNDSNLSHPLPLSSRPERSAVEGPAVLPIPQRLRPEPPLSPCHPDRSAQWSACPERSRMGPAVSFFPVTHTAKPNFSAACNSLLNPCVEKSSNFRQNAALFTN